MNIKNKKKLWTTCFLILSFIFVCSMINCKSPESPEDIEAKISVSNEYGIAIDIYMNGVYQFSLEFLIYEVIENVSGGVYKIDARKKGTMEEVASETVNVNASGDYWVSILSDASIKVINQYGESLNIYTNGSLQGELGDQESQVFTNVPFGDHILEASKASDNTLVASTTVTVDEEKEYSWTIK